MKMNAKNILKRVVALTLALSLSLALGSCKGKDKLPDPDASTGSTISVKGKISYDDMMKKLAEAKTVNELASGYIVVPGTNIDHPVIMDSDERNKDNDYWIDRNLEGEVTNSTYWEWKDTAMYLEVDTMLPSEETAGMAMASKNFVVFGHNWNNLKSEPVVGDDGTGEYTMFAQLPSFLDIEFAEKHPYIYFSTPEAEMVFKVFAVMYTEQDWSNPDEGKYYNYISPNLDYYDLDDVVNEMKDRSVHDYPDVEVNGDDRLVTLSTCTRAYQSAGEEQRYVVVGRLLREGETDSEETAKVYEHASVQAPNL